jgi:hypothetical protein
MRLTRKQLKEEAASRAGCRILRVAQSTGTLVGLYQASEADLDVEAGDWATVCEDHGGIVYHPKLRFAQEALSHPDEWCPTCQNRGEQP